MQIIWVLRKDFKGKLYTSPATDNYSDSTTQIMMQTPWCYAKKDTDEGHIVVEEVIARMAKLSTKRRKDSGDQQRKAAKLRQRECQ